MEPSTPRRPLRPGGPPRDGRRLIAVPVAALVALAALLAPAVPSAPALAAARGATPTPNMSYPPGPLSRVIFHGPRTLHAVALTFDDGWNAANCAATDRILRANHAGATFFPAAKYVQASPALWRDLAQRYPFGNHSVSHPHMLPMTYDEQLKELTDAKTIVEGITGVPLEPYFRATFGEYGPTTLRAAAAAGATLTIELDVNVRDAYTNDEAELIKEGETGTDGSIILFHCGPAVTLRILQPIIDWYKARGFAFVTVPDLLAGRIPPDPTPMPSASPSPSPEPATPAPSAPTADPAADVAGSPPAVRLAAVTLLPALCLLLLLVGSRRLGPRVTDRRPGRGTG